MRKVFFEKLREFARKDNKIIFLTGDVGFSFVEEYKDEFPKRYINCGITEQSMMGIAAGLAYAGWKPYVYSMVPFVIMRCYEQLRGDVCYANANVKVVGIKGGESYRHLGYMHNMTENEDINILSSLPNLQIYIPQKLEDVLLCMDKMYVSESPAYIRLI